MPVRIIYALDSGTAAAYGKENHMNLDFFKCTDPAVSGAWRMAFERLWHEKTKLFYDYLSGNEAAQLYRTILIRRTSCLH